jgi:hypothetical protein
MRQLYSSHSSSLLHSGTGSGAERNTLALLPPMRLSLTFAYPAHSYVYSILQSIWLA